MNRNSWLAAGAVAVLLLAGMSLSAADLTTLSGKTYRDYTVLKVLPDAVQVSHAAGVSKVPLADLPPEIREQHAAQATAAAALAAKAQAAAEAAAAQAPDAAVARAAAVEVAAERRQQQAAAVAAEKERYRELLAGAEPHFTVGRTTFMKEGGGFLPGAPGKVVAVAGETILVDGVICTRARPELMAADAYRAQAEARIAALETAITETIPGKIADNEDRIRSLEHSILVMKTAAAVADDPVPFEAARQAHEVRKLRKENKSLEKDKGAQEKLLAAAKAELVKIDRALADFLRRLESGGGAVILVWPHGPSRCLAAARKW